MAKRRKTITAWASVGTNGHIYCCEMAPGKPELVGRYEIFKSRQAAEKIALGPRYVREVKIYIDAEPPSLPQDAGT